LKLSGLIAKPDGSIVRGQVTFTDRITALEAITDVGDDYILPGFVDLQVNGSHGIDVMNASADSLAIINRHLALEGTTAWMPTAVTAPIEKIEKVHESIATAFENSKRETSADGAAILGMHLEGPFISPLRLGAHLRRNLEPSGDAFERVLAMRALRLINHRDPGVIAAALAPSAAVAGIIPDGVHVHPAMLRLAFDARGRGGLVLVTDKVALAGTIGSEEIVGRARATIRDGAARLEDGTLAGSIISMLDGVRIMVETAHVSIGDAAVMAASNPARLVGANDRGCIQIGARADLIVLSRTLELKCVFIGGREIS
jgi:N-acetylglucosamine-6-phosphate deacetylase